MYINAIVKASSLPLFCNIGRHRNIIDSTETNGYIQYFKPHFRIFLLFFPFFLQWPQFAFCPFVTIIDNNNHVGLSSFFLF